MTQRLTRQEWEFEEAGRYLDVEVLALELEYSEELRAGLREALDRSRSRTESGLRPRGGSSRKLNRTLDQVWATVGGANRDLLPDLCRIQHDSHLGHTFRFCVGPGSYSTR